MEGDEGPTVKEISHYIIILTNSHPSGFLTFSTACCGETLTGFLDILRPSWAKRLSLDGATKVKAVDSTSKPIFGEIFLFSEEFCDLII